MSVFIDGAWRDASDGGTREIRCPADGTLVTTFARATADDTRAAVLAARTAFDDGPWPHKHIWYNIDPRPQYWFPRPGRVQ